MIRSRGAGSAESGIAARVAMLFLSICGAGRASAQQCPRSSADTTSIVRPLTGKLLYHNGIRQWFELKLDRPTCGRSSVQITGTEKTYSALQKLRGCHIETSGALALPPTGYYTLDLYQYATALKPIAVCPNKPLFPVYTSDRPDRHVRAYTVGMHVDYSAGDHPVMFDVQAGTKKLMPWQAYASYLLTGGLVLYGRCGQGFVVDRVFGTPAARPAHFDEPRSPGDMAAFDPETAAQSGKSDLHLGYTCIRAH